MVKALAATLMAALLTMGGLVKESVTQTARLAEAAAAVARATAEVGRLTALLASERRASAIRAARAKMRQKAVSRLQRMAAAVPLIGVGAALYFEESDYREWLEDHPEYRDDGVAGRKAYLNELYELTVEILDGEYKDLRNRFPAVYEKSLKRSSPGATAEMPAAS